MPIPHHQAINQAARRPFWVLEGYERMGPEHFTVFFAGGKGGGVMPWRLRKAKKFGKAPEAIAAQRKHGDPLLRVREVWP